MIFVDDNIIKVGGVMLPGLVKSLEIQGDAKVEEQEVEGSSAKPKQATGYEDAKITLDIVLDDSKNKTKEEKLKVIQNLFKKAGQSKPRVYEIVNQHTSIRNISRVIFKKLSTKETNKNGEITVSIEFWEYVPVTIVATKSTSSGSETSSVSLNEDYQNYLSSNRGSAPDKLSQSPANQEVTTKYLAKQKISLMLN